MVVDDSIFDQHRGSEPGEFQSTMTRGPHSPTVLATFG